MKVYEVVVENRDEDGNVINSDYVYKTINKEEAIQKAKNYRKTYGNVVIEVWGYSEDGLIDTMLESNY